MTTSTGHELLNTVWPRVEGVEMFPLLCTTTDRAVAIAHDLSTTRICDLVALGPCCKAIGGACIRDSFAADYDRPAEILMRTAMAHGITWPADLGRPEPEYSVFERGDREQR